MGWDQSVDGICHTNPVSPVKPVRAVNAINPVNYRVFG
jgi:hypothetical protein